ncbi:MAG: CotH kinase family protein [Planctomycetes bacterium]|nr:CotH kinase family protein [Planctomycetota bacterium]
MPRGLTGNQCVRGLIGVGLLLTLLGGGQPALLATEPTAAVEPTASDPFATQAVWSIEITLTPTEFAALPPRRARGMFGFGPLGQAALSKNADGTERQVHRNTFGMDLPWTQATVRIGTESFTNVGLRYKGNGTIGDASRTIKKSLKIDFDHFGGEARYQGLKTINLHCEVADPSKCRETVGYALYRAAGVPAPRTALAEVFLNVPGKHDHEFLGVYTVVEQLDKAFLRTHFGSEKGLLMKPEGVRDFEGREDNRAGYHKRLEMKREATPEELQRLQDFARLVENGSDDEFAQQIGSFLDIENFLRFLGVTAFVANPDSFFVLGHNYYVYLHPTTNKLHFIPWDLDRSFANFPLLGTNRQQMKLSFQHPYPGPHKMTDRVLKVPAVAERYRQILEEYRSKTLTKDWLLAQVRTAEQAVAELRERDQQAATARKDPEAGMGPFAMFGRPPELTTFMEKRFESLEQQLDGRSTGFVPKSGFGQGGLKMGSIVSGHVLETLDADHDEVLSREEWTAAIRRLYETRVLAGETGITQKQVSDAINEMFRNPEETPAQGKSQGLRMGDFMAAAIVRRADADKNGQLTAEELLGTAETLFDKYDPQKSGKLDDGGLADLLNELFPVPNFGGPPGQKPETP